jgi:hypothetical protein
MRIIHFCFISLCILFFSQTIFAGAYKCIDGDGHTSFQSRPCRNAAKAEEVKLLKTSESIKMQGEARMDHIKKINKDLDNIARKRAKMRQSEYEYIKSERKDYRDVQLRKQEIAAKEDQAEALREKARAQAANAKALDRAANASHRQARAQEEFNSKLK